MPILRARLAAESLPSNWPNEIQRHHPAAAGPCGYRNGGKKRQRQTCLSAPPSASYFTFTLYSGYDLVSKSILRGEKGCQAGLKPCQQTYRGQGFGQPVGEGTLSLRPGVGTRWDWEIPGDLTGTSNEQVEVQNPSGEVTCSLKVTLVFNQTRLFNLLRLSISVKYCPKIEP